jgi:hypothetical protein
MIVKQVVAHSPAARQGLRRGDLLLRFGPFDAANITPRTLTQLAHVVVSVLISL